MSLKPVRGLFLVPVAVLSAFLLGCGSSSCDKNLPTGTAGACGASSSGSGSTSGSGTGSTSGSGSGSSVNAGPFTISGSVIGLTGTGLVLQDNGGDNLPITQSGPFTFKTAIIAGGNYNVTISTQPSNQPLPCSVTNGSGTAAANVTNVQITCGNTFTVSGTVSGLQGTGLVLQDNGSDNLTISGTGSVSFTFATPLAGGTSYNVTILTQPSNPGQTCTISNGSGSATGNVTTVQVNCPETGFTVGGSLVGLVNGAGDTVELMNNGGDNILVTGNNTNFIFPTLVTAGGAYDVNIFAQPTSQTQGCWIIDYEGVATFNISNVIIDCQHNDWKWIDAPNTADNFGTASLPPPTPPSKNTNSPGGRQFAATWTDSSGRRWIYGGWGLELSGKTPPDLPGLLDDLWLYDEGSNGWIPAGVPINVASVSGVTTDTPDFTRAQSTDVGSSPASSTASRIDPGNPGARWGSISWSDSTGNLWLFGGQGGGTGVLNDLWEFTPTVNGYDVTTPAPPASATHIGSYTYEGTWSNPSSGGAANYGTQGTASATNLPGARWGAAYGTNPQGTFVYVFGGQGLDGSSNLGLLNDLWKYNIGTGQWTWLGPTNSTVGQNNGVYGTQGTAAATNAPGGRQQAKLWVDSSGNVWLFGGLGLDSAGTRNPGALSGLATGTTTPDGALLNDLWEYNAGTSQWTWISGGELADQNGVYGTAQVAAASNVPGSRWGSVGFIDALNNIWLVSGWGYGSATAKSTGYLNDVWQYVQSTGQWIWWKGSSDVNQPGSFPTDIPPSWGVPYVKNTPGGRFGAASWKQDLSFYFWVFGGEGDDISGTSGRLSDLLTYLPFPQPQ
jgi:hypothetical protein